MLSYRVLKRTRRYDKRSCCLTSINLKLTKESGRKFNKIKKTTSFQKIPLYIFYGNIVQYKGFTTLSKPQAVRVHYYF